MFSLARLPATGFPLPAAFVATGAESGGFPLVAAISAINGSTDRRAITIRIMSALSFEKL